VFAKSEERPRSRRELVFSLWYGRRPNLGLGPSNPNPLILTLTQRPLYMKTNLNAHPCGKHNSRGCMRTKETSIFSRERRSPLTLIPGPGWGKVEVHREVHPEVT